MYTIFFEVNMKAYITYALIIATAWSACVTQNGSKIYLKADSTINSPFFIKMKVLFNNISEEDKNLKFNKIKKHILFRL